MDRRRFLLGLHSRYASQRAEAVKEAALRAIFGEELDLRQSEPLGHGVGAGAENLLGSMRASHMLGCRLIGDTHSRCAAPHVVDGDALPTLYEPLIPVLLTGASKEALLSAFEACLPDVAESAIASLPVTLATAAMYTRALDKTSQRAVVGGGVTVGARLLLNKARAEVVLCRELTLEALLFGCGLSPFNYWLQTLMDRAASRVLVSFTFVKDYVPSESGHLVYGNAADANGTCVRRAGISGTSAICQLTASSP